MTTHANYKPEDCRYKRDEDLGSMSLHDLLETVWINCKEDNASLAKPMAEEMERILCRESLD